MIVRGNILTIQSVRKWEWDGTWRRTLEQMIWKYEYFNWTISYAFLSNFLGYLFLEFHAFLMYHQILNANTYERIIHYKIKHTHSLIKYLFRHSYSRYNPHTFSRTMRTGNGRWQQQNQHPTQQWISFLKCFLLSSDLLLLLHVYYLFKCIHMFDFQKNNVEKSKEDTLYLYTIQIYRFTDSFRSLSPRHTVKRQIDAVANKIWNRAV